MNNKYEDFFEAIFDTKPSPYQHIADYVDELSQEEQEYLYHFEQKPNL